MSRLLAATLLSLFFAAPAGAQIIVFHDPTNTGTNPGAPGNIPIGPGNTAINLFYTGGPNATPDPNQRCNTPGNNEVCALDWLITATGGVTIQPGTFVAAPGSDWVTNFTLTSSARGNGGNPLIGEGYPTPTKIGTFQVTASGGGNVQASGQGVNSGLNLVGFTPVVLAIAGGADFDGDLVPDATDSCPTIVNMGDPDGDGVDNACDNCRDVANAPFSGATTNRTRTGGGTGGLGQLDDDADGRGNACDMDYNQAQAAIGAPDTNLMVAVLTAGRSVNDNLCGPSGTSACGIHDHNQGQTAIGAPDTNLLVALLGSGNTSLNVAPNRHCGVTPAALCSVNPAQACCSPFSRPIGSVPVPTANKAICLNATGVGAPQRCVFAN